MADEAPWEVYPSGSKRERDVLDGTVPEIWMKLWEWAQSGKYKWRETHKLEKAQNPEASEEDMSLELHLPIEER